MGLKVTPAINAERRPGLNLRRWGPRPSGGPVVLSTRLDQYGDLARVPPGGVGRPPMDEALRRNLYSLVTCPQLGSDVSRGRPLVRGYLFSIFITVSSDEDVPLSAWAHASLEFNRRGTRTKSRCHAIADDLRRGFAEQVSNS